MALYVHLVKMTREGATTIRELSSEYTKWKSFAESLGAKPVCVVGCFGEYDFVTVMDYPNEVAAMKAAGYASALGIVQTQTLPACPIEDFINHPKQHQPERSYRLVRPRGRVAAQSESAQGLPPSLHSQQTHERGPHSPAWG